MKFASWNIAGGHILKESFENVVSYEKEDIDYFIGELKKVDADVVVLQESHTPVDENEPSQAKIIADQLGYALAGNHPYRNKESSVKEGNWLSLATLSKHPVQNSSFHKLPNPNISIVRPNGDTWVSFDVGFLINEIDYHGTIVQIATGHLVPFHYFKRDFMEDDFKPTRDSIIDLFISLSKIPTIIGGDFNYGNLTKLLPPIFKNNLYQEAFIDTETTPGRGQQDHVLFSRGWTLVNAEVRKVNADHFLCIIDAELAQNRKQNSPTTNI